MEAPNRMLKQSASSLLETREAYLVERRSFPDLDVSLTTSNTFLSILEECSAVVPHVRTIESLAGQHRCSTAF